MMGGIRGGEVAGQLAESGTVTATTLWVLAAASAFAWILVREWVPQTLGEWMGGIGAGRWGFLALTVVLIGILLLISRLAHVCGLSQENPTEPLRIAGTVGTHFTILGAVAYLAWSLA